MTELEKALKDIQKIYGENSVGISSKVVYPKGCFSTGSIKLDRALTMDGEDRGGFPRGKLTELYGPPSSGKSTLSLYAIADCQKQGLKAVYMDLEGTFDKSYAVALGVDLDNLILIPPMAGEDAISIAEKVARTGEIGLLVVDSVATMLPVKDMDGDVGNANMAYHAKLVGKFVKRFVPLQHKYKMGIIMINQLRLNPGVSFGNPEYTTGGSSPEFYSSVRIDIRKKGAAYKDKDDVIIGEPRKITIKKSKINSSANTVVMADIYYGLGIDNEKERLDLGVESGAITKTGGWYTYEGTKIGNGAENAKQFLRDHPEIEF